MKSLGPRPVADPALRLSAARGAVLAFLVEAGGPVTVLDVASSSGQHVNTVREHLEALVNLGLVARERTAPSGRGRPAIAYAAVAQSSVLHGQKEYASLIHALVLHLKSTSRDVTAESLAVGRNWAKAAEGESCVDLLGRMGFEPVPESANVVRLRTCPVLAAARQHPDVVCVMHLGMLRAQTGEDAQLAPFVEGGCRVTLGSAAS